ncbi:MAG: adenylate/guanylate cyclase domain-containing protein [Reyranella sp.]
MNTPTEIQRTERKLAAILAADVVGYSRLMSHDEEGTLNRLKAHLGELVEPHIAAHRGRIVKRTGDGLLVDFASAVEAVRCAVAIQAGMADRNRAAGDDSRIEFRIGINLGDVIIEGEDIYGDGVNIAARLESLADPGGIFVSRAVRDSVRDKLGIVLEDLGEKPVKNIARPVRVFRIGRADGMTTASQPPAMPDKPSIAVLPFTNMSGDAEQEYFSDGISEDLITDLSKVSALFVIARNSSFTYKGKTAKVQEIGRELGVRFVLEGSIRKAGNRVRITAQLIDATSGGHLWADRFDRDLTDIFATQDEVVQKIVGALAVKLTQREVQQRRRIGTRSIEAYECWLRARELLARSTRESVAQCQTMHRRAAEIDPAFAAPHAGLAFARVADYVNGWADDQVLVLEEAEASARRAIELDEREPVGYVALGNVLVWRRRHDDALVALRHALEIESNYAQGRALMGMALMYSGRPAEALEAYAASMRLDPYYPNIVLHLVAQAHFSLGQDETAAACLLERIARNPNTDASRMLLASSYGHLDRAEEARVVWAELLHVTPGFSINQRAKVLPYKDSSDFDRIVQGLAKAGLPS